MSARPKPSERLGELLEQALDIKLEDIKLHPARGHYRSSIYADVMRWTGYAKGPDGIMRTFGSWDTMTACVRHGITVNADDRPFSFMVYAKSETPKTDKTQ